MGTVGMMFILISCLPNDNEEFDRWQGFCNRCDQCMQDHANEFGNQEMGP